jgi:hypothetical protein
MKTFKILLVCCLALAACKKTPDNPPPAASSGTPDPPPASSFLGVTTPWSGNGRMANNSSHAETINGFDLGCGDSVRVFLRPDSSQAWFELETTTAHSVNYYSLEGEVVTIYNNAAVYQDFEIQAILK